MRDRWAFTAHYTYTDAEDNLLTAQLGDGNVAGPADRASRRTASSARRRSWSTRAPARPTRTARSSPPTATRSLRPACSTTAPTSTRGTSSLALEHTFVAFGQVRLPLNFELAAIFRHQSGFPFSRSTPAAALDIDGNQDFSTRDYDFERNSLRGSRLHLARRAGGLELRSSGGSAAPSCSSSSTSPTNRTRRRSRPLPAGPWASASRCRCSPDARGSSACGSSSADPRSS